MCYTRTGGRNVSDWCLHNLFDVVQFHVNVCVILPHSTLQKHDGYYTQSVLTQLYV